MLYTLIGVSPPPITLPATNRSIIIPCACHRHHWEQPNFRHISISRSLLFGRSWRTYEHSLRHRLSTGKVPEDLVFNFQSSFERNSPSHHYIARFFQFWGKLFRIILNIFSLLYLNASRSIPISLHICRSLVCFSIACFTILKICFSSSLKLAIISRIMHSQY